MAQDLDIYGQNDFERNAIVALPDGYAEDAGNTLYAWLSSLWRTIHRGDDMVRGLQQARGLRLAQLYLNLLEAAKLQDRNGAPVFHRELWHPIVLRRSQRNRSQENMLQLGGVSKQIGPQQEQEPYGVGTVLEMGRLANYADFATYPITKDIVGGAATIVDNIIKPTVVMNRDNDDGTSDFEIRNNSIIFPKGLDPLAAGSAFEKYDMPNMYPDPDDPDKMVSEMETVLWASDVLIDKDYLAEHLSYPLGANAPSSAVVKRILNAAWSSVASGLTPELLRTFIAAMLNIPVVQHERETVTDITISDTEQIVHTDKGEYRVSPRAHLAGGLHAGSKLLRGDFLDEAVRIYPYLSRYIANNRISMDGGLVARWNEITLITEVSTYAPIDTGFEVPIEQDVPSVVMPASLLRARTEYGVYAMWGETEVKAADDNPEHLYFDLGGTKKDQTSFWKDVWKHSESAGVSMESLLGGVGTVVSPARFFLKHFVGQNTIFIVVDRAQLEDESLLRDPMFFGMLSSVVPSAIRLFVVEHMAVGSDDEMSLAGAKETTFLAAALPCVAEQGRVNTVPGRSVSGMSVEDGISARFIRVAPAKTRVRKEEV